MASTWPLCTEARALIFFFFSKSKHLYPSPASNTHRSTQTEKKNLHLFMFIGSISKQLLQDKNTVTRLRLFCLLFLLHAAADTSALLLQFVPRPFLFLRVCI